VYHFTADLSTGTLRVRPIIKAIAPNYRPREPTQREWTLAEGLADLAECRASVCFRFEVAAAATFTATLLCG
jgi:hypothetical protein